jgi:prevent-host-death family protein
MNIEIGSYEAKTKLPELLRGIQAGNRYTITLRGQPVANLVPVNEDNKNNAAAAVDKMFELMKHSSPMKDIEIKALINEGRA